MYRKPPVRVTIPSSAAKSDRRTFTLNLPRNVDWYKDEIFAIENPSHADGAYSDGLLNAKLTQDGCIACPTTDST
ncbi:hypothetical protein PIB30_044192 [Stylosanthes scabra]|uniref:Uncharacterized protein n=1 Tax=Stylosanthes scabra TaxID=79078 RepID=A0ABU6QFC0_9FABA|nr:hypothetical protein [Stylosanthes scabra]